MFSFSLKFVWNSLPLHMSNTTTFFVSKVLIMIDTFLKSCSPSTSDLHDAQNAVHVHISFLFVPPLSLSFREKKKKALKLSLKRSPPPRPSLPRPPSSMICPQIKFNRLCFCCYRFKFNRLCFAATVSSSTAYVLLLPFQV